MAYNNKIVFDGETLIDLTEDTITPDDLRVGVTAHDASGAPITGTLEVEFTGTVVTELPYQDGVLYYDGEELTPTWVNYDPEIMAILFGTQSAVDAGTYSTYFYLAPGYVWPNGSSWREVTWQICTVITDLPYQDGYLYYDGEELTPTWANYDPEIMTISGETSAIEAGTYTAVFTLVDGYVWPDGSDTLNVEWTIEEESGEIPSGDIYVAFYSEDDDSLNFCGLAVMPEAGQVALGKTITTVYEGVESTGTTPESVPWYEGGAITTSTNPEPMGEGDETMPEFGDDITSSFDDDDDDENIMDDEETVMPDEDDVDDGDITELATTSKYVTVVIDESFADAKPAQTAYWFCNFDACTSITGLEYLDTSNVTDMEYMFYGCSSLTTLDISILDTSNVTNTNCMCYGCSWLYTFDFQQCKSIGTSAFQLCTSLPSAIYPSCTTVGSSAFRSCTAMKSISFPSCTTLNQYAFANCSSLTAASFSRITTVPSYGFFQCSRLSSISFPSCTTISAYAFQQCSSITTASFSRVTAIDSWAFYQCSRLSSINFPSCTSLRQYAFANCSSLTSASFSRITTICPCAFQHCSRLSSISFPSCTMIDQYAFRSCTALTTVSFSRVTTIGFWAFDSCTAMTSISFPSCTTLSSEAFADCTALATVSFPSCTTIRAKVFWGCTKLSQAYFMGSSVISLDTSAFYSTSLANGYGSIYVPSSLVDSYKVATNWSSLADRIVGL